jgi:hypothetical protein
MRQDKRIQRLCARSPNEALVEARRLERTGALKDAQAIYEQLVIFHPQHAELFFLLGTVHARQHDFATAVSLLKRAVFLNPNYLDAYKNLARALGDLRRYDQAVNYYDRAIALHPTDAEAHCNRGFMLYHLGDFTAALCAFFKAIELRADYADAYHNISLIKLLLGDYEDGWRLFEWRWRSTTFQDTRPLREPLWEGSASLAGKTILVYAEQGAGDTIQFCRYVPLVAELGATVLLEVQQPLLRLMTTLRLSGAGAIFAQGFTRPSYDFHCPLMSLPVAFKTTLDSIPATVPYLSVDTPNLHQWQVRLGQKSRPRIGLVWSGAFGHKNDANRSIALSIFKSFLHHECDYHSLQKEVRPADLPFFSSSNILCHAENLADFTDTASLVSEMDLVISVDTSVAHLAGALAKNVWVLLPFVPDYRWLMERDDSPWYPTARLFRQPCLGDWNSVINKVESSLAAFISTFTEREGKASM